MKNHPPWQAIFNTLIAITLFMFAFTSVASAVPVPGGTVDPTTIPKYATPLVIPPVMPKSTVSPAPAADYDIAVRQFKQQILPTGLPATTVWSYGRAQDVIPANFVAPVPLANGVSFNYPAFTVENSSMLPTNVRWVNDLVDPATGNFIPHMFNVDQTLHWANPTNAGCTTMPGMLMAGTDCHTENPLPYTGPVPLVTHVHGAHVQPDSDGYPQAWWLPGTPGTKGIPTTYAQRGSTFTQANIANNIPGTAYYSYENSQPASTLWYHDHALGMTRLNVYAGPAGFWLIRGGANDLTTGLPGPAPAGTGDPNFNAAYRATIREIPIAIQDRSFDWADAAGTVLLTSAGATQAKLFYPADRTFFDGFAGPYIVNNGNTLPPFTGPSVPGVTPTGPSDMSGIWNPEAFFNTMVVNGNSWPNFEVAPARYRLRLLDGCNSRTLNLALFTVTSLGADGIAGTADDVLGTEIPFYQIGSEQGFLSKVVKIRTGFATPLPGNGTIPATEVAAANPLKALLMGPAERADVIVDFTGIATGTRIRMINTAPDAPFQGFNAAMVPADALTTGQVMDFIVNTTLTQPSDAMTTAPESLVLPAEVVLGAPTGTTPRKVSLNEMGSAQVCIELNPLTGAMITRFSVAAGNATFTATCLATAPLTAGNIVDVAGPRQALLGTLGTDALGKLIALPKMWSDPITETPLLGSTEIWEVYNSTMDAHPIHLHLVRFEVVNREDLNAMDLMAGIFTPTGVVSLPQPNELGYKDTVIAYPGQVTRIKAKFDIAGLYVWHCHIVEHEDNEMMRPYTVSNIITGAVTTTAAGVYKAGSLINVTLNFGKPVTSTGLVITLNNGAVINTGALANASTFSGTFTVAATGQETPVGQSLNIASITGTITDAAGNASSTHTIPAGANIANSAAITIDTTPPVSTASPAAGTFAGSVSVTLTANEATSIHYTVDGTVPTTASPVYTSPILLTSAITTAITIKFFAVDLAGNAEATVNSVIYNITDATPPISTASPAAGNYTGAVIVTLTVNEAASIYYTIDGTTPTKTSQLYLSPFTISSAAAATITVKFFAVDLAGNVETTVNSVAYNLQPDTTPPVSSASPPPGTYAGPVSVTLTANEAATIYYTMNGTTPTTASLVYVNPIVISSPTTATKTVKFFAVDTAGNVETTINSAVYNLHTADLTAKVAINNGKAYTNSVNALLSLSASDPAGVSAYAISTDNVTYLPAVAITPAVAVFSKTNVPVTLPAGDGQKTVYVKFTDALGVVYPPVSASIILETMTPVVVFTPQGGDYGGKVTVSLTSPNEPEGVNIYYTTDGSIPTTSSKIYKNPFVLSSPSTTTAATIVVKFFAKDFAGNVGVVQSVTYRFVANPDMTTDVNINNDAKYTNTPNVSLKVVASDPIGGGVATMSFSNDGINFTQPVAYVQTNAKPWTLDPANGRKTVYFRFTDVGTPGVAPITYTFTSSIILANGVKLATGDCNGDNVVDILDSYKSLLASSGLIKLSIPEQARCDVAPLVTGKPLADGKVDSGDAYVISKKVAGLISF